MLFTCLSHQPEMRLELLSTLVRSQPPYSWSSNPLIQIPERSTTARIVLHFWGAGCLLDISAESTWLLQSGYIMVITLPQNSNFPEGTLSICTRAKNVINTLNSTSTSHCIRIITVFWFLGFLQDTLFHTHPFQALWSGNISCLFRLESRDCLDIFLHVTIA